MPTITCRRLVWISFSRLITIFIPNFVLQHIGGLKTPASRNAWREKIALFFLFLFIAAIFCFWLEFISSLFCDSAKTYNYENVFSNSSHFTAINGKAVNWHHSTTNNSMINYVNQYSHQDLSPNFPNRILLLNRTSVFAANDDVVKECINDQQANAWFQHFVLTSTGYVFQEGTLTSCPIPGQVNQTGAPCFYGMDVDTMINSLPITGDIKYDPADINQLYNTLPSPDNMTKQAYVILDGYVLDITTYLSIVTNIIPLSSTLSSRSFALDRMFLPLDLTLFLFINLGKDITDYFDGNVTNPDLYKECLIHLFQKGIVPSYVGAGCSRINPALWATMGVGLLYFLIKMNLAYLSRVSFIQRLLFVPPPPLIRRPYTILMVPCFAESSDTLKQTLDTLSRSAYDDDKKLLLFVCDGITTSQQEEKETHVVLLACLGYSSSDEPIPQPYTSLGQGKKRINYARVYSGYYETGRNRVPYLVIVKCGGSAHHHYQQEELQQREAPAGNRGKRDSLILVFGFLERCMNLANNLITPLDYELFNQCYNVLGIDPRLFKYLLVTDADIQVQSDIVQKLVSRLEGDRHLLAVSGHVRPANPEKNLTTMLQIFPVYMVYFSGLAYEACLTSVMTIQGGLVMYKIWTEEGGDYMEEKYLKKWKNLQQQHGGQSKWPKISDEISDPFQDYKNSTASSINTATTTTTVITTKQQRPESRLSFSERRDIQPCCVHPTVLRGLATPRATTMHMQNVLLQGEEKILPMILLKSHPGYRLGFEPDAVGYATLPTNFFALQGNATRNLRASFHVQLEMHRVSWQLGITYWILSTTEILDMIFSMPIIVYLYGVFGRTVKQYGMAYLIITCSFTGLVGLHILFFLLRRQFRYILWFVLYCLLSVPLFAIWFPLLAVWQSNDADLWYDVWPIKGNSSKRYYTPRLHGILDSCDGDGGGGTNNKEKVDQEEEEEEVPRMRLRDFEVIEAKRLHQAAEAALDSNFIGFTAATTALDETAAAAAALSPPLAAQLRVGLHSTRIMTSNEMTWRQHRYVYPESPVYTDPFADYQQPTQNPFDDDNYTSTRRLSEEEQASLKSIVMNNRRHRQSHSQSSYFTYASKNSLVQQQQQQQQQQQEIPGGSMTLPSSLNSSGFLKMSKDSMMMTDLSTTTTPSREEEEDTKDRTSTTLSIQSFSLLSHDDITDDQGEDENFRHQRLLDNHIPLPPPPLLPPPRNDDEGRSVAIHNLTNNNRLRRNNKSNNSLSLQNMSALGSSNTAYVNEQTEMIQQAIKLEIKSYLMRVDLENTTRAQVKHHLKEVFGSIKIDEVEQFVVDCIDQVTVEFLS